MFLKCKIAGCLLLIALSTGPFMNVFAQSKGSRILFSTNIIQIPINEVSIYVDRLLKKKQSVGVNAGIIYPVRSAAHVPYLSNDQFPGSVSSGWVARANYKRYYFPDAGAFVSIQGIFKATHYGNTNFEDRGFLPESYVHYTRSERSWLAGLDLFLGNTITNPRSALFIEVFYGLGVRYKARDYTTSFARLTRFPVPIAAGVEDPRFPLGNYTRNQIYPTLVFGFKMGLSWLTD